MTAYNITSLQNRIIDQQASEAFRNACISEESYKGILKAHTEKLYTPDYFVRLALGILTLVAVFFTTALGSLLFYGATLSSALTILLSLIGFTYYVILECLIKSKKCYNAGVDNVLMFSALL